WLLSAQDQRFVKSIKEDLEFQRLLRFTQRMTLNQKGWIRQKPMQRQQEVTVQGCCVLHLLPRSNRILWGNRLSFVGCYKLDQSFVLTKWLRKVLNLDTLLN